MISKNSVVASAYKEQTMENVSPEHTQDSQEQVPDGFSPLSGKIGDVKNDSKTNRGDSSIVTQGAAATHPLPSTTAAPHARWPFTRCDDDVLTMVACPECCCVVGASETAM